MHAGLGGGTVQVQQKGQPVSTVPIAETGQRGATKLAFVNLKALSGPLGYAVTWLPDARRADVERVRKIPGGLSQTQGELAGLKLKPTRLNASAEVRFQPLKNEPAFEELFLSSPARELVRIWPFFPRGRMSAASCESSPRICQISYDKTYLWTLGYVELKESAWQ